MAYRVFFYGWTGMGDEIAALKYDGAYTRREAKYRARRAFDTLIERVHTLHPEYIIEHITHDGMHYATIRECEGGYPHDVVVCHLHK